MKRAAGRCHEMRGHDDDQLGLFARIFGTAEQGANNRDVTQPRNLTVQVAEIILQKAGNRKAFAIAKFNRCCGFAAGKGVDADRGQIDAIVGIKGGNRCAHFQIDQVAIDNARHKVQFDAERFEFDCDGVVLCRHRNRILATGKERSLLAGQGCQVRFGKHPDDAFFFHRFQKAQNRSTSLPSCLQD